MIERVLTWCVVAPFFITAILLFPAWQPWRRGRSRARSSWAHWMLPIALCAAYVISHMGLRENWTISFPPANARLWIVLFVPMVLVVSVLTVWRRLPRWIGAVLTALTFAGFFGLLLQGRISNSWTTVESIAWIAGLMTAASAFVVSLTYLARKIPIRSFLFPIGLFTALAAAAFGIMGSAQTAMQAGALATALGVVFLLAVWNRDTRPAATLALPIAFLIIAQMSEVYFFSYAENPTPPMVLLFVAPSLMWTVFLPGVRSFLSTRPTCRAALLTALVLLPTLAALGLAYRDNIASLDTYDPYAMTERMREN